MIFNIVQPCSPCNANTNCAVLGTLLLNDLCLLIKFSERNLKSQKLIFLF